ncbi:hypothetical protein CN209_37980, partial [Sinorhizobium meliloti]
GRHHLGIRGRLFLGIGGRDHFGIRGRIASEFAGTPIASLTPDSELKPILSPLSGSRQNCIPRSTRFWRITIETAANAFFSSIKLVGAILETLLASWRKPVGGLRKAERP